MKKINFINGRHYKIVLIGILYPAYWDEGIGFHKSKGRRKNKEIMQYQYREYRTWKYNRKTKYKILK